MLYEVEKAVNIKKDVQVGGPMFADDFVGLTTNAEDLQILNNVVQGFCNKIMEVEIYHKKECCYGIF